MPLDNFDASVLLEHGDPQDIVKRLYDKNITFHTAKKYVAGIRMHLNFKDKIQGEARPVSEMETVEVKADGSRTTSRMLYLSEEDNKDPIRVMALMGYDPLMWELVSCKTRRNYWDVTIKNAAMVPVKSTNHAFMVTLTVKPIQKVLTSEYIRDLVEGLDPPVIKPHRYNPGRMMLELPLMDLHLGKLAWGAETGADYDLKIAIDLFKKTVDDITDRVLAMKLPIEVVEFPIGQDLFHTDNSISATTSGTPVDTDSRWQKMFTEGINALLYTIERLRVIAPVMIRWVGGNHDKVLSYCATYVIYGFYRNCPDVTIDLSPEPRKYIHYGVNLIGMSHGKEGKRIEHLMQQERPEEWGASVYREWHLGDLHHEEAKEVGGVKIRRISSVTATDAWHAEKGYRSIRMAQAFVWDRELGRQLVIDSNVSV